MQAYRLHQQLAEDLEKRDEWREKDKETPLEERERLLRQVKADNQEIATLQKKYIGCILTSYKSYHNNWFAFAFIKDC